MSKKRLLRAITEKGVTKVHPRHNERITVVKLSGHKPGVVLKTTNYSMINRYKRSITGATNPDV